MISGSEDEAIIIQNEAAQWKKWIDLFHCQSGKMSGVDERERESGETLKEITGKNLQNLV